MDLPCTPNVTHSPPEHLHFWFSVFSSTKTWPKEGRDIYNSDSAIAKFELNSHNSVCYNPLPTMAPPITSRNGSCDKGRVCGFSLSLSRFMICLPQLQSPRWQMSKQDPDSAVRGIGSGDLNSQAKATLLEIIKRRGRKKGSKNTTNQLAWINKIKETGSAGISTPTLRTIVCTD